MQTEKEELLELIAHKLHFVENPLKFIGINDLAPLSLMSHDYEEPLKCLNMATTVFDPLPIEAGLVFLQLKDQSMSQVLAHLPQIMQLPGLQETHAKLQDRVVLIDDVIFKSSGELEQLEMMAEVFYPKFFAFGYEGKAWVKLSL